MQMQKTLTTAFLIGCCLAPQALASDTAIKDVPMPEVIASLTETVCVLAAQTGQPVEALLPVSARPFTKEDLAGRLQTRPYEGQIWAIETIEGPVIIGTISDTPGGCQVLAATPFSDALTRTFEKTLQSGPEGFELTNEHGSGIEKNGVTWSRYKTSEGLFLDTMMYAFKGTDKEGTLHVIFKP